ncbi:MAG: hypothetical protein U0U46_17930 [Saprospiraceae bacterium]
MHHITAATLRTALNQGELYAALSDFNALAQNDRDYDARQAAALLGQYEDLVQAFNEGRIDETEKTGREQGLTDALLQALDRPVAPPPAPALRAAYPEIRHKFRAEPIADNAFLVTITVTLRNRGQTPLTRLSGNVRVSRLYPLSDPWQQKIREQLAEGKQTYFDLAPHLTTLWQSSLDDKKIGLLPGEREQLTFKRIVAGYLRGIEIQTAVYDPEQEKQLMAWKHTTFHFFKR